MKATVNIGFRKVTIEYSIDKISMIKMEFNSSKGILVPSSGLDCGEWEILQKTMKSKKIECTQTFYFNDCDEWKTIQLLDGRVIDFHYDYEERSKFKTRDEWASYIFQGYEHTDGEPQLYDVQVVDKVVIVM
jgi:major membrane immunogen (membrane-anchored lipoprotein)